MVLTPKGDIILSSLPSKVLLVKKDSNNSGRADGVGTLLSGLHNPSGLFLDGDQLYIVEEGRILRVGFDPEASKITGTVETVLPKIPGASTEN
jgi:glucose/arabinose dehydrogenase